MWFLIFPTNSVTHNPFESGKIDGVRFIWLKGWVTKSLWHACTLLNATVYPKAFNHSGRGLKGEIYEWLQRKYWMEGWKKHPGRCLVVQDGTDVNYCQLKGKPYFLVADKYIIGLYRIHPLWDQWVDKEKFISETVKGWCYSVVVYKVI